MNTPFWSTLALNAFSVAILLIITVRLRQTGHRIDRPLAWFLAMAMGVMGLLVLDTMFWLVDGIPAYRGVNTALNLCYFFLQPLIPWFWVHYLGEQAGFSDKSLVRRVIWTALPWLAHGVVLFSTPWTGSIFTVDVLGTYGRGGGFWVAAMVPLVYLAMGFAVLLIWRHRIPGRSWIPLFSFGLFPMVAGLIQAMMYGVAILWPSIALSLLVIYLWVEGELMALDFLTGLQNRRSLFRYLERRLADSRKERPLGILLIDVDDFKVINDTWGHAEGDQALRTLAHTMRTCFHHHDVLARLGGDEFVAVLEVESIGTLARAADRFQALLRRQGQEGKHPWTLSVSIGQTLAMASELQGTGSDRVENLLGRADAAMYQDKSSASKDSSWPS